MSSPPAKIGLGCVTFGREIDRAASFAMMDHALAHGITLFDTASAYGSGASESIVGEWLGERGLRRQVVLATKILPPYEPEAIESAVAASLARLGVSDVDVLFVHRWDETVTHPDSLRALDALVRQGRVRALGASNFSAEQLTRAVTQQAELGLARFAQLQNNHNLAVRGFDRATLELCSRFEIATIGFSPLGAGFLTGKHEQGVQPGSRFDLIPGHQRIYFNDHAWRRLAKLREISARSGHSMVELALAWALWQPHIDTVLVGGRTLAHIDQARQARKFADAALLEELGAE
jgi:1-deoxyxylulose-5-phosphate synthase